MFERIPRSRAAVYAAVVDDTDGADLESLCAATGLAKSTVSHHLRRLERDGLVDRVGHHPEVGYRARSVFRATWTRMESPPVAEVGARSRRVPFTVSWSSSGPVDLRFPFVTRIVDEPGREVGRRFLERMWNEGVLTPWLLVRAEIAEGTVDIDMPDREEFIQRATDPRTYKGLTVFVHGSCARGDARDGSDLDVLVVYQSGLFENVPFDYERRLRRIAAEINVGAARPIDLVMQRRDEAWDWLESLSPEVRNGVLRDGVTIYSTHGDELIEGARAGGRHAD